MDTQRQKQAHVRTMTTARPQYGPPNLLFHVTRHVTSTMTEALNLDDPLSKLANAMAHSRRHGEARSSELDLRVVIAEFFIRHALFIAAHWYP
jgi:hypothetical protein